MSRKLELPDDVYDSLREAAEANGMTPAAWISARLPMGKSGDGEGANSLAERFAGRVGQVASGGRERLSEGGARRFTDHLETKRRAGHL